MDYEFSDIPLEQQGKRLRLNNRFGLKTAYGQLIALVFIPICILALVGKGLVLAETDKAAKAQQQFEAMEILQRHRFNLQQYTTTLDTAQGRKQAQAAMQEMHKDVHLNRAAIMNDKGEVLLTVGRTDIGWPALTEKKDFYHNNKTQFISGIQSEMGDVYGVAIGDSSDSQFWLMVDIDNEQLMITQYRVWLVLAITGLSTILLLLLCLNIYSKRWITPIYEMRLHLQQTDYTNLYQPMHVSTSGEINLLQRDITALLRRLHLSYQELKEYSEQTEDDLRNSFDEVEIKNISMHRAMEEVVIANDAKSAFLTNISHELRTPLNSIDGFINLLSRNQHNLTAEQNMYVQTIRKSSAHLLALVNDVLDFSKIEAGKLVVDQNEVDLYSVIYDVVDMLTPLASEKNINLAVFFYDDVPTVTVTDELRCKQVLTNLVSNALKFTKSGEVIVRVSVSNVARQMSQHDKEQAFAPRANVEQIVISVQDTGRGVSQESRENLFKRFSQADKSITRKFGGTGLGLVISKKIVHLLNGFIGYKDNVTEEIAHTGSTFWFSIPMSEEIQQPVKTSLAAPKKVLAYVEHEASMKVLAGSLHSIGAQLTNAASTAGLLERFRAKHSVDTNFDWVVLDGGEDLATILPNMRENYSGNIAVFGYQMELDLALLEKHGARPLYQPIDRRYLLSLLSENTDLYTSPQAKWANKHVLAVDDHMPNLMVLDALLTEIGVTVTTVNSGADAIDTFNHQNFTDSPFDLVFMDIQMPYMSGFEATQQIRALEKAEQHTPIIALTAHALADEKERLLNTGMDDYAGKPISHLQLVALLTKWFDGKDNTSEMRVPQQLQNMSDAADISNLPNAQGKDTDNDMLAESKNEQMLITRETVALPVIDWQDALSRAGNKPVLAKDILSMLITSLPEEKELLEATWEMADIPELGQIVHKIVGGTRYTGVPMLRSIVQQLDQKILAHIDEPAKIAKPALQSSYNALLDAIDVLIAADLSEYAELKDIIQTTSDNTHKS